LSEKRKTWYTSKSYEIQIFIRLLKLKIIVHFTGNKKIVKIIASEYQQK